MVRAYLSTAGVSPLCRLSNAIVRLLTCLKYPDGLACQNQSDGYITLEVHGTLIRRGFLLSCRLKEV